MELRHLKKFENFSIKESCCDIEDLHLTDKQLDILSKMSIGEVQSWLKTLKFEKQMEKEGKKKVKESMDFDKLHLTDKQIDMILKMSIDEVKEMIKNIKKDQESKVQKEKKK